MERGFWPARHHQILIAMLMRIVSGATRRGMLFVGPGTAKSTYTSKILAPWIFAQKTPHGMPWDVLSCTHTAGLAEDFSKAARANIRDDAQLLGYGISAETDSVTHWMTTKGDSYRCAGVGQAIAGKRADIGIIDDPVPSRKEADSPASRKTTWDWYCDDFRKRVKPTGSILIVMTRWHEDDLAGRILPDNWDGESGMFLAKDGRETWEVVSIPSLCDRPTIDPLGRKLGESVWPEWMPVEWLKTEQATSSTRSWSALHQQRPAPDTGDFFQRDWLQRYTAQPVGMRCFVASDWATPNGNDFSVHVVMGVDPANKLYLLDVWRGTGTTAESIDAALDLIAKHKAACWLNEKGVLWRMIDGQAKARMRERNIFCPNEEYARTADKETMARAIQGRWSQGMVLLPESAPWLGDLEHELLRFPAGKHDDQVDALALIGLHLDKVVAPPVMHHEMIVAKEDRPW